MLEPMKPTVASWFEGMLGLGLLFYFYFTFYCLRFYLFIFRQSGREGEREEEKHQCVVASHVPQLGIWPATQACALTGNQTGNPLVRRPVLNPLSHTSQGRDFYFKLCISFSFFLPLNPHCMSYKRKRQWQTMARVALSLIHI